ncbi:MAG: hypothetical protein V4727_03695 [Verrucomicrobiota bacterium]
MKILLYPFLIAISIALAIAETDETKETTDYHNLVSSSKLTIDYDIFGDSTLLIDNSKNKTGNLNEILDYIEENKINGDVLVITVSKITHMDLNSESSHDLGKTISSGFEKHFKRVLVKLALSNNHHGVVYDSKKED